MLNDERRLSFWLEVSRWSVSPTPSDAKQRAADVDAYVDSLLAQARAEEREACAKVADEVAEQIKYSSNRSPEAHVRQYAAAIRARKDSTT